MRAARALLPLLLAIATALVTTAPVAPAEAGGFIVNVSPGKKDLPLALPAPQSLGADTSSAEVWAVVHRDLEMTGYFDIIDPMAYVEKGKGVEPGTFDFADWRLISAAALAKTRVSADPASGGLRADVYVYDVAGGSKIDAKGFAGKTSDARYLGHKIADEILMALTGEKGFFGSRIAAVGVRNGHKEIFVMDIDGHGVAAVTNNATINLSPAWSPTGDRIAFTSFKKDNADLYVKELKTGRLRAISERPGMDSGGTFSPDGKQLALTRSTDGDSDIYVIDAVTGEDVKRITTGGGIDVGPNWSPAGGKIAFSSDRSGGQQIYVHDLASGSASRVTFQGSLNTDPVISPDGSRIAFVGRDKNFDIFVVDMDGRNMVRITQDHGDNEDPAWSPDGKYLLFSSTRSGKSEIWMSTADGRHQVVVTAGSSGWTQPSWGPY